MALNPSASYPGQIATGDTGYPYGKARNVVVEGDGTGTPWEQALVNDVFGFQQALLEAAGIAPSGLADKVGVSQYLDALRITRRYDIDATLLLGAVNRGTLSSVVGGIGVQSVVVLCRSTTTNQFWSTIDAGATASLVTHGVVAMRGIATNGTTCVAVGDAGTIKSATIAAAYAGSWTNRAPGGGYAGNFRGVAWSPVLGLFVAVGASGGIHTSPDGTNWTQQNAAGGYVGTFESVDEYNGLLVICGSSGQVQTSSNGTVWNAATFAFPSVTLTKVVALPHKVVVSGAVAGQVWESRDGSSWSLVTAASTLVVIGKSAASGAMIVKIGSSSAWEVFIVDQTFRQLRNFTPKSQIGANGFGTKCGSYWVLTTSFDDQLYISTPSSF